MFRASCHSGGAWEGWRKLDHEGRLRAFCLLYLCCSQRLQGGMHPTAFAVWLSARLLELI
jgi:hypothetical protein